MKFQQLVSLGVVVSFPSINARNDDQFNFRGTVDNPSGNGNDYGPTRWDEVTCDTLGQCVSPKGFTFYEPYIHSQTIFLIF